MVDVLLEQLGAAYSGLAIYLIILWYVIMYVCAKYAAKLAGHVQVAVRAIACNLNVGINRLNQAAGCVRTAYPICWGLAEGSNTISPQAEAFFYGALDILAKVRLHVAATSLTADVK